MFQILQCFIVLNVANVPNVPNVPNISECSKCFKNFKYLNVLNVSNFNCIGLPDGPASLMSRTLRMLAHQEDQYSYVY